jgi:hypothetical protein
LFNFGGLDASWFAGWKFLRCKELKF